MTISNGLMTDYFEQYTKDASMYFNSGITKLNIFTQTFLTSYSLSITHNIYHYLHYKGKKGYTTSILNQPSLAPCNFEANISICLKEKYETTNLNTVIKEVYGRDRSEVFFSSSAYINFSEITEKAWVIVTKKTLIL